MSWRQKSSAGSLIGAFALLIAFFVAGASAYAHGPLDAAAVHNVTTLIVAAAGGHDHARCPADEDTDCSCCCHGGACSLSGCVLPETTTVAPVVFSKAAFDLFIAPRPDTAAAPPDLPPPRTIV
jgi:hypothetical protein